MHTHKKLRLEREITAAIGESIEDEHAQFSTELGAAFFIHCCSLMTGLMFLNCWDQVTLVERRLEQKIWELEPCSAVLCLLGGSHQPWRALVRTIQFHKKVKFMYKQSNGLPVE